MFRMLFKFNRKLIAAYNLDLKHNNFNKNLDKLFLTKLDWKIQVHR